jgi:glycine cleavage system H protein
MTEQVWRGCVVPEDRLYDLELHVWVVPDGDDVVIGMTDVAQSRGGRLVTASFKRLGRTLDRGHTVAVVESAKWVGPFPTPLSGVLVETNQAGFEADILAANKDPYGKGWMARIRPTDFEGERHFLTDGADAYEAYLPFIDDNNINCFRGTD